MSQCPECERLAAMLEVLQGALKLSRPKYDSARCRQLRSEALSMTFQSALAAHDAAKDRRIAELEEQLEAHAWKVSPAMAQEKLEQQAKRTAELEAELKKLTNMADYCDERLKLAKMESPTSQRLSSIFQGLLSAYISSREREANLAKENARPAAALEQARGVIKEFLPPCDHDECPLTGCLHPSLEGRKWRLAAQAALEVLDRQKHAHEREARRAEEKWYELARVMGNQKGGGTAWQDWSIESLKGYVKEGNLTVPVEEMPDESSDAVTGCGDK